MATFAPPAPVDSDMQDQHLASAGTSDPHSAFDQMNGLSNNHKTTSEEPSPALNGELPQISVASIPESSLPSEQPPTSIEESSLDSISKSIPESQQADAPVEEENKPPVSVAESSPAAPAQPERSEKESVATAPAVEPASTPAQQPDTNGEIQSSGPADEPAPASSVLSAENAPQPHSSPPATQLEQTKLETPTVSSVPESVDQEMKDVESSSTKLAREREDDDEDHPAAKRTKTEEAPADSVPHNAVPAPAASVPATASAPTASTGATGAITPASNSDAPFKPTEPFDSGTMTENQRKRLAEGLRNIKKAKAAFAFLKPVDPVQLQLPTYFDIIKKPMDIATIEQKLKDGQYPSVDAYTADFDQMVHNSFIFNGGIHPVTMNAQQIRSQLHAQLRKLPKSSEPAAVAPEPKKQRSMSVAAPPKISQPRSTRPSLDMATSPGTETFAAPNGVPTIRRASSGTGGRPKREIHKPSRDLAYQNAKPIKKKFRAEIDFCKHVLHELTRPRYQPVYQPFEFPVDPVALAIPTYYKVVKKPMDLETIKKRLNSNQYENAKEFENDFRLIFANAFKFNGRQHPVSLMAAEYERALEAEMGHKSEWIAQHAPSSGAQSVASDYDEDEEEGAEEEEEDMDDEAAKIAAIQAQMQALQKQTEELLQNKSKRKSVSGPAGKKGKLGKGPKAKRKSGGATAAPLTVKAEKKSKPKAKPRPVTMNEKTEISSKIGELSSDEITQAAELIKNSLRKAGRHDLADKAEDEMEFDIDQIPDDALQELLKLVRKSGASAPATDAPTYSTPARSYSASKPKKNKPMSKAEQEENLRRLQGQMSMFENPDAAQSPADAEDDEDGSDADDSGSESEEE